MPLFLQLILKWFTKGTYGCIYLSKKINKVRLVKAIVFPVVMYECESWTIKKAECQWIDAFELWCWRILLRVPWTTRRSNQSILVRKSVLNSHWKDWCCSWNSNTMATWCKELTHLKRPWSWERLRAGGEGDDRGWDGWMASLTQWTWVWVNYGNWQWIGRPGMLQSMGSQKVRLDWAIGLNWTEKDKNYGKTYDFDNKIIMDVGKTIHLTLFLRFSI